MYSVEVMYPTKEGARFDIDYYLNNHLSLVSDILGDNLIKGEVRKGIASGDGSPAKYVYIGQLWISSVDKFQASMEKRGGEIMSDISKYTDIEPIIQIQEVLK